MESYSRVLVGTDGSAPAQAAARSGGRIAARLGVPLEVIAVWEEKGSHDQDWAAGIAAEAEEIAKKAGATDVTSRQISGKASEVMINATSEHPDALFAIGAAGLTKPTSRLVGSTSNRLADQSHADVLFAHDPAPRQWNFVALATDGSETAERAVRRGMALAVALGATPLLITVAKNQAAGDQVLAATFDKLGLGEYGVEIEREVLIDTQPARAILLSGWKYELVVIGNKGMGGAIGLLGAPVGMLGSPTAALGSPMGMLGSTASKVTHGLKTNLLLVNTTHT